MSSTVVLLVSCAAMLAAAAAAAGSSPVDGTSVAVVPTTGSATSRQVVDGVLSMLGITTPEASGEDDASAEGNSADTKVATTNPGQRGIHKKKLWYWHIWQVYSWWAWAFAVVVVKFKIALLVIMGHLTYFVVALIRMLLRELKTAPAPYGPPPPVYGPPPTTYGPQYGQQQYGQQQYAAASSYSPYKRRAGTAPATAGTEASSSGASDLAYAAHARRK
ncbi:uncharacterized protein LOC113202602 isoform X2 [Frankliniella occidentalis]|uniref:Uncharacterized protein LOC113202602 isoform X2 n=1 Tax=Frankliniella occidentalis TaxID=133901 RepID=A0A9C6WXR3_FRAOC|nr:uncharacterized protein LOC113202602 isoform X2 [Frankliniella occidentalis]